MYVFILTKYLLGYILGDFFTHLVILMQSIEVSLDLDFGGQFL
jgi:hypothetical protein